MPQFTKVLRQHALMCAHQVRRHNPDNPEKAKSAYERAMKFDGHNCPTCWVDFNRVTELKVEASLHQTNFYLCNHCEFGVAFSEEGSTE
ncbi:hypothetical protein SAMN05216387_11442 [Nitrosovibrio tenuis]|uniref:Uncharacterized protein n=1 Tax=Nitrosovibrio tenuis TaxID=1233 RepID=A0A1H7R0W2_9PROT|nr:hypothetical protein SAMN05216387_11442 [Nitrosovibrio tenuis]